MEHKKVQPNATAKPTAKIVPKTGTPGAPTSWGGVADWYDGLLGEEDTYQKEVILPNLLRLMAPKAGMHVLDLACGQGFFSRALAASGAKVTGVDISPELIDIARSKSPVSKSGVPSFAVSPADHLPRVDGATFDVVLISLAIQNIENLQGTFDECARVLKPGGKLFIVMNHPAFRVPKRSGWGWDDATKSQYRRVDAYLSESKEEIVMNPGKEAAGVAPAAKTVSFHRPLQLYFKKLQKAGFAVSRLEEWNSHKESQPGPRGAEENRIRKEIPMFLCLEGVKVV
ncbi:MAG: class I SAM-dependent methyltransferase [Patescibacteria group bacterium]